MAFNPSGLPSSGYQGVCPHRDQQYQQFKLLFEQVWSEMLTGVQTVKNKVKIPLCALARLAISE